MLSHMKVARESILLQIGGVVIFAALVAAFTSVVQIQLSDVGLIAAGVVLALVPAALWLWMFYQQDRIEPEPRGYVIGVFMLGALLAYAIGQPVIRNVFAVQNWLGSNWVTALVGLILVGGFVQQFLLYAAVRYSVYNSVEFDERIDGIIYGAAAGLGYATMFNVQYVVGNSGVDLGIGVMRIAVEALSLASLGGVSGYFLARAKFDKMGPLWLPIGMIIAATLNGVVDFTLEQVPTVGNSFQFNPWYGLVVAVIIAGATFFVLFQLIHRLNVATAAGVGQLQESKLDKVLVGKGTQEEPEWMVWLVVAIALIAGWLIGSAIMGQTQTATVDKMSVTYPATWVQTSETDAVFAAYDLERGGVFGTRISLRQMPKADLISAQASLYDSVINWTAQRQKQLSSLRLLKTDVTQVNGRDAVKIEYAYLMDSPQGAALGAMPALMRGVDTLVVSGDQVYAFSFATPSQQFDSLDGLREQLLASWRVP
ncbi:Protease PrsW [Anaerolineae bacterium]|nr:Protease PrsW [Anaerolineae bacterium]